MAARKFCLFRSVAGALGVIIMGFSIALNGQVAFGDERSAECFRQFLEAHGGEAPKTAQEQEAVASCRERSTIRPPGVGQPERRNEIKPSFECWKAKTASARLICSDDELAQLDSKLGAVFQQRKAQLSSAEQSNFVHNEVIWIKDRNKRCDLVGKDNMTIEVLVTSACLLGEAIQSRVSELEAQISAPDGPVRRHQISLTKMASSLHQRERIHIRMSGPMFSVRWVVTKMYPCFSRRSIRPALIALSLSMRAE